METENPPIPTPPPHSEVHYLRLGRLLMISAVVFMLLFTGTSAAILWRIQDQAEHRARVAALGKVETAWQWLADQLELMTALVPRLIDDGTQSNSPLLPGLVGQNHNWYALRAVSETGGTVEHIGPVAGLPGKLALPEDRTTLAALPPLKLGEEQGWVAPILFPTDGGTTHWVGFLNYTAFENLFARIHPDGMGSLSLFSASGILLLRHPFPDKLIGNDFSGGPLFSNILAQETTGTSWAPETTDGVLHLVAHHKLNGYPFVMTAGLEAGPLLERARREILTAAVALVTVLLFIGVLVALLIRQFRLAEGSRRALLDAESRLRELATHDSLTGCLNRRAILVEASEELNRFRRNQRPFALLMIDVDNFKTLNDRYGHLVGDSILVGMSALCRDLLRPTDQIGRYGGEEFLILLPETDEPTAAQVANRLRTAVGALAFETGVDQVHITLSIGVAAATSSMQSLKPLIQKADEALYAAKAEGRDRVQCSGEVVRGAG